MNGKDEQRERAASHSNKVAEGLFSEQLGMIKLS